MISLRVTRCSDIDPPEAVDRGQKRSIRCAVAIEGAFGKIPRQLVNLTRFKSRTVKRDAT